MIESGYQNILKLPELKKKLLITFALLFVYRVGVHVPTPGIDTAALASFFDNAGGTLFAMFNMFCDKFLPIYARFWPSLCWLAVWSAPVRYSATKELPARNDTAWKALRITIRRGVSHSKRIFTIKKGII